VSGIASHNILLLGSMMTVQEILHGEIEVQNINNLVAFTKLNLELISNLF